MLNNNAGLHLSLHDGWKWMWMQDITHEALEVPMEETLNESQYSPAVVNVVSD